MSLKLQINKNGSFRRPVKLRSRSLACSRKSWLILPRRDRPATAPSSSHELKRLLAARGPWHLRTARDDAVEPVFTIKIAQQLRDIATGICLDGATAGHVRKARPNVSAQP
jgi:hypothetical protein